MEHDKHQLTLTFIINGQAVSIEADPHGALKLAVEKALVESNNTGRPAEEWEVRDVGGVLLEQHRTPDQLHIVNGARLFLSLRVGAGGACQA